MNIFDVKEAEFEINVTLATTPILVDFWAPWCGPCRRMEPVLKTIADHYDGKVRIAKINIDECEVLPGQFGVRTIPCFILFNNAVVIGERRQSGSASELMEMIDAALS